MNASAPIAFHARPPPHPESATWTVDEIEALYSLPFLDLVFRAAALPASISTRSAFNCPPWCRSRPAAVRKTAATRPQSAHHDTRWKTSR